MERIRFAPHLHLVYTFLTTFSKTPFQPEEPPSPALLAKRYKEIWENHPAWNDIQAVISRYNLDALKSQASLTLGKRCTTCDLIDQGGYNTVELSCPRSFSPFTDTAIINPRFLSLHLKTALILSLA